MRLNGEVLRACKKNDECFDTMHEDWPGAEQVCRYIEQLEGEALRLKAALTARDATAYDNVELTLKPLPPYDKPLITPEMLEDAPGFEQFVKDKLVQKFADAITEPMLPHISDCENCTSKDRNWCWMSTHGSIRTDVTGSCECKCHA